MSQCNWCQNDADTSDFCSGQCQMYFHNAGGNAKLEGNPITGTVRPMYDCAQLRYDNGLIEEIEFKAGWDKFLTTQDIWKISFNVKGIRHHLVRGAGNHILVTAWNGETFADKDLKAK